MTRHYDQLLERAEDLQEFSGYLDTEDRKRLAEVRVTFRAEVRVFVYDLFKEGPDRGALPMSVSVDFDRIAKAGTHRPAAIDEAREAVLREIRARTDSNRIVHFAIRWGPPALMAIAACAYVYLKAKQL